MKNRLTLITLAFLVLTLSGFSRSDMDNIERAVINEDYKQLQELALKGLAENPSKEYLGKLKYYLALSYVRLGEHRKARDIFEELVKGGGDSSMQELIYMGLFDCYYLDENYLQAEDIIARLLKIRPKSEYLSLIYLKYARVNFKLAHWDDARHYLEKIISDFPDSLESRTAKQLLKEKTYFAVQVGSFLDRARAEQLMEDLRKQGEYVYIVETIDQKNQTYYRVRVGQLAQLQEAQKLRHKLSKRGYLTQIYP